MLDIHHDLTVIGCSAVGRLVCLFCTLSSFVAAWEIVRLEDKCNKSLTVIDSIEGEIQFRLGREQMIHCVATVEVPSRMHISLTFAKFYLHASNPALCDDTWLMLYDGPLAIGGKELTQQPGLCGDDNGGTKLPASLYTNDNSFTIWLGRTTTRNKSFMEFRISYVVFQQHSDGNCFKCANASVQMCIDRSLTCDHRFAHCPDGSDEDLRMCYYQTEDSKKDDNGLLLGLRTTDVIGITIGVSVFLVVMIVTAACFCRSSSDDILPSRPTPCSSRPLTGIDHVTAARLMPVGEESSPIMPQRATEIARIQKPPTSCMYQKHCRRSYNPALMTVSEARRFQLPLHCRTQSC